MMDCFSEDYFTGRAQVRDAVGPAGGGLTALPIAARGPGDQELSIDVGWFGVENPKRALVHSSGVHGVEAFVGSAIHKP